MTIRGILYPVKTEPVLTDAQRPEQVTESRWHQPLALPVRLRALATAVVVASGLAAPVYVPAPVEAVTLDKWHSALSQPVLRKADVGNRTSFAFVGPDVATIKWFAPLSEPVRSRALATSQQDILAYAEADPFPETVSLDRWQQPLSQPTRRKPTIQPDALDWSTFTPAAAETVTVDKWFADFQRPAFPRGLPVTQQDPATYVGADPFAEAVSIDRWQQPLSVPTRRINFAEHPAFTRSFYFPAQPDITVEKWHAPLALPTRLRALPTAEQQALAFVKADPFPETVSLDRWQQALSEPARRKLTVQPSSFTSSWFTPAAGETVTLDKWFVPPSQPVLPKRGLSAHLQNGFTKPVFIPPPVVTTWFAPLAYRVQPLYRGLPAHEQQALAFAKATPFAETVTLDRWVQSISLPVRRTVSVAYHPASFWGVLTPSTVAPPVIGSLDDPEDFVLYTAEIELWFLTDRSASALTILDENGLPILDENGLPILAG